MKTGIVFLVLAFGLIASALYLATDTRANIKPPPEKRADAKAGERGSFRGAEKVESKVVGEATTEEELASQLQNLEREAAGGTAADFSIEKAMASQQYTLTPLQKQVRDAPAIGRIKDVIASEGFVVLDSGRDQNLQPGMNLAVRRKQHHIVAKLIVGETIEDSEAVANIAPDSVPNGVELRQGDAVIPWADIVKLRSQ